MRLVFRSPFWRRSLTALNGCRNQGDAKNLRRRFELLRAELKRCDWSDAVSEKFGEIKAALERTGQRIEDFDVAIAAHAIVYDAILVTANMDHMGRIPSLSIEDWSA
ncbi:MAG: tRNA(fMet)-specific endonuclease VapC [Thermoanaerobaculia bacterium]|jgi:tRNA(fMet)-specific endonuclease VapC|nr:tRNA(fMet)-specific endonuclease VapC [Thermoanaerobaculia bacterium]